MTATRLQASVSVLEPRVPVRKELNSGSAKKACVMHGGRVPIAKIDARDDGVAGDLGAECHGGRRGTSKCCGAVVGDHATSARRHSLSRVHST